jgi:hypothetical protein
MARTKVKILTTRKARFKAALAHAGLNISEWLRAEGISRTYLNQVLSGERVSERILGAIDAFTADVDDQLQRGAR